jgi:hypothetical protein
MMIGLLLDERESKELDYILRKELDEMLLDLKDRRIDENIRRAIDARYRVIFRMFARFASPKELSKYARNSQFKS